MTSQQSLTGWARGLVLITISVLVAVAISMFHSYQELGDYLRTWAQCFSGGAILALFTSREFLPSWPKWRKIAAGWAVWFGPLVFVFSAFLLIGDRELYDRWLNTALIIAQSILGLWGWMRLCFPGLFVRS